MAPFQSFASNCFAMYVIGVNIEMGNVTYAKDFFLSSVDTFVHRQSTWSNTLYTAHGEKANTQQTTTNQHLFATYSLLAASSTTIAPAVKGASLFLSGVWRGFLVSR